MSAQTTKILVFSHRPEVRETIITAVGRRPAPDLPRVDYVEAGAIADVLYEVDNGSVDLLILETFFRLDEMLIALDVVKDTGVPIIATMSFRPTTAESSDGVSTADCAVAMVNAGAHLVGANCEQDPERMLPILRSMRAAVDVPLAAQPAAFRTTDETPCFTKIPEFPDELETVQTSRKSFTGFAAHAHDEGIGYLGGCCGCNATYIRAMRRGLQA